MRFLKQRNLSRRIPNDTTLYSDVTNSNVYVSPIGQGSLVMPNGPTGNQPTGLPGMMRYDTTTDQVIVFQGGTYGAGGQWRALRFKESVGVTRETYTGDGYTAVFGPLNPQPPGIVQNGATWTGDNLIVIVGNVYQTWSSNYLVVTGNTIGDPYNAAPYDGTKFFIQFTSAVPGLSTPIVILHGFDQ